MLSVPKAFAVDCGRACLARAVAPLRCALRRNMARGTILEALDFLVLIQQLHEQSKSFVLRPQIISFVMQESLQLSTVHFVEPAHSPLKFTDATGWFQGFN